MLNLPTTLLTPNLVAALQPVQAVQAVRQPASSSDFAQQLKERSQAHSPSPEPGSSPAERSDTNRPADADHSKADQTGLATASRPDRAPSPPSSSGMTAAEAPDQNAAAGPHEQTSGAAGRPAGAAALAAALARGLGRPQAGQAASPLNHSAADLNDSEEPGLADEGGDALLPSDPGAAALAAALAAAATPTLPTGALGGPAAHAAESGSADLAQAAALSKSSSDPLAGAQTGQRGTAQRLEIQDQQRFGAALGAARTGSLAMTQPGAEPSASAAPTNDPAALSGPLASALAAFARSRSNAAGTDTGAAPDPLDAPLTSASQADNRLADAGNGLSRGSASASSRQDLLDQANAAPAALRPGSASDATLAAAQAWTETASTLAATEAGQAGAPTLAPETAAALQQPAGLRLGLNGSAPGAAVAQGRVDVPVQHPGFGAALGAQLSLLVQEGVQEARLQLHPAELGPITVQIALNGGAARVDFQAEVAATRSAIEASLPALAGALQDAGFTLAGGGVSQQGGQGGQAQPGAGDGRQSASTPQAPGNGPGQGEGRADSARPARVATQRGLVDLVA